MEFHEKLQELRKQRGLTQEELAKVLFVSRAAVSKWESGRGYPNIESLKTIAKFYDVTLDDLLSGDEILSVAEEDSKEKQANYRDLVFGLLDCGGAMLFVLPFFGQKAEDMVRAVSLLFRVRSAQVRQSSSISWPSGQKLTSSSISAAASAAMR